MVFGVKSDPGLAFGAPRYGRNGAAVRALLRGGASAETADLGVARATAARAPHTTRIATSASATTHAILAAAAPAP